MSQKRLSRPLLLVVLTFISVLPIGTGLFLFSVRNPSYTEVNPQIRPGTELADYEKSHSWSLHRVPDLLVFGLFSFMVGDSQYFRDGIESVSFRTHLDSIQLEMPSSGPALSEDLPEGLQEIQAHTLEGPMKAAYLVYRWSGCDSPTLIYNHGASQVPFDALFRRIFPANEPGHRGSDLNLIAIRAPFHTRDALQLNQEASTLSRFLAMQAVTVALNEAMVQELRAKGCTKIALCGLSMGGYAINRHRSAYNSADIYLPVAAGTHFSDVFLYTSPAHESARDPQKLSDSLDLDWSKGDYSNVHPLLGQFDQVSRIQVQGPAYGNIDVEIWETGHITTATSVDALRAFFLKHLSRLEASN